MEFIIYYLYHIEDALSPYVSMKMEAIGRDESEAKKSMKRRLIRGDWEAVDFPSVEIMDIAFAIDTRTHQLLEESDVADLWAKDPNNPDNQAPSILEELKKAIGE